MDQIRRSDLVALQQEIARLWEDNRLLRQKLATTWEQAMVRFGEPLYDSGWQLSAAANNTFAHNLGKLPLLWSLMAAEDSSGTDPTPLITGYYIDSVGHMYGVMEWGMSTTILTVRLGADGYGFNGTKWYQRGTDYIRCLIWATEQ